MSTLEAFEPLKPAEIDAADGAALGPVEWTAYCPAPSEPPETVTHFELEESSARWVYRTAEGAPHYGLYRFDTPTGKQTRPYTYGRLVRPTGNGIRDRTGWQWRFPTGLLSLYNLDQLTARPDAPVIVVEGEKAADAAAAIFPDHVATTSAKGSRSADKSDWSPLAGRTVTIWPDADEPGAAYASDVARLAQAAGAADVRIVAVPEIFGEKWDLADPAPDGFGTDDLREILTGAAMADAPIKMPDGYFRDHRGLWCRPRAKPDGDPPPPVWCAGQFDVTAEARTSDGQEWGLLLRWRDRDGRAHEWVMPRKLVHADGATISEMLEASGLRCGTGAAHAYLRAFLSRVEPRRRIQCVTTTGWHDAGDQRAFVAPWSRVYGADAKALVLQADRIGVGESFAARGTLAGWQRDIAALAIGNDAIGLALCIAFAGPLLDVVGQASGGFHLVGASQIGKSTAAFVAGSVWGRGDRSGQVRQWRTTSNGLEAIAAETTDSVLILDEAGQADAREFGDIVYALANEGGKSRAGRSGEARRRRTWRIIALSTGEITVEQKIGEAGKRMMAGLDVRLISLDADAGTGHGIFNTVHDFAAGRDIAIHLAEAARTHYGTPARAYLDRLAAARAADPEALRSQISGAVRDFLTDFCPPGADSQVQSVAARFGLVAAAGELAREYGVLPWPLGEAIRAAGAMFNRWLDARGNSGNAEETRAIAQVRAFIERHGAARFETFKNRDETDPAGDAASIGLRVRDRAGFVRASFGGAVEYLILPEQWKNEVCAGIDPIRTAKALAARGWLIPGTDGRMTQKPRLPGMGSMRVYVLSDGILGGSSDE